MLARRFTIVCLVAMLFGMMLASVVARTSDTARSNGIGTSIPCVFEPGQRCAAPFRR